MFKKILNKILEILKNNYKYFISLIIIFLICTIKLPYYIETPGGIINVEKRFKIDNAYESSGSFNLAYVGELNATIPTYIIAKLNKNWDILKKEEILVNENESDMYYRDKLMLEEANNNAIKYAYNKASAKYEITDIKLYVTYVNEEANTDLKIKDEIISVDGKTFSNKTELNNYIKGINEQKKIIFKVINNNIEYTRYAYISDYNNIKAIGRYINQIDKIKTNPKITFNFKDSESGSSGGLMMSLAIYNSLTKDDITNGKIIVGTGTIDENGKVGEIDGVKYKLKSAVSKKADIFFTPSGNYNEALKEKKKNNYNIKIVEVKNFDDALNYLKNIKKD